MKTFTSTLLILVSTKATYGYVSKSEKVGIIISIMSMLENNSTMFIDLIVGAKAINTKAAKRENPARRILVAKKREKIRISCG